MSAPLVKVGEIWYNVSMKILGIESSCDETAAAVVEDGAKILSNVVVSQIDIFKEYGGVIPEVAARSHLEAILPVIHKALDDAGVAKDDIDVIAVTHTPGLLGSLLIGTLTARTLAILWNKPLYGVHHLKSHIYTNWLCDSLSLQDSFSGRTTTSNSPVRGSSTTSTASLRPSSSPCTSSQITSSKEGKEQDDPSPLTSSLRCDTEGLISGSSSKITSSREEDSLSPRSTSSSFPFLSHRTTECGSFRDSNSPCISSEIVSSRDGSEQKKQDRQRSKNSSCASSQITSFKDSKDQVGQENSERDSSFSLTSSLGCDTDGSIGGDDLPQFPLLALVISGGHTQIIYMSGHNHFEIIGTTRDDAVGECFDKVAKILGLPYPGGPSIARAALDGDPRRYKLPHPKVDGLDFSFSGLKTAVLRAVQAECGLPITTPSYELKNHLSRQQVADFAASFQDVACEILLDKLKMALESHQDAKTLVFAGGVSANKVLREKALGEPEKGQSGAFEGYDVNVYFPDPKLSGDNAVMVAVAAYYEIVSGVKPSDPYSLSIAPRTVIN